MLAPLLKLRVVRSAVRSERELALRLDTDRLGFVMERPTRVARVAELAVAVQEPRRVAHARHRGRQRDRGQVGRASACAVRSHA